MMLVKATAKGYLGSLREAGDEFEVPDGTKSSWFAPVAVEPEVKPAKPAKAKAADAKPSDDVSEAI
jgi:hypothetical protein